MYTLPVGIASRCVFRLHRCFEKGTCIDDRDDLVT